MPIGKEKDSSEINSNYGEVPAEGVPVEIKMFNEEMKGEGNRLDKLRSWAKENKKVLVITGSIGGVTTILFTSALLVKHLLDRNPRADITKK